MVNAHIKLLQSTWCLVAEEPLWGELVTAYADLRDSIKRAVCREVYLCLTLKWELYCIDLKKAVIYSDVLFLLSLFCFLHKCNYSQVSVFQQI